MTTKRKAYVRPDAVHLVEKPAVLSLLQCCVKDIGGARRSGSALAADVRSVWFLKHGLESSASFVGSCKTRSLWS